MNDVKKKKQRKQKILTNTTENRDTEGGKVMQCKKREKQGKPLSARKDVPVKNSEKKRLKRSAVNIIRE